MNLELVYVDSSFEQCLGLITCPLFLRPDCLSYAPTQCSVAPQFCPVDKVNGISPPFGHSPTPQQCWSVKVTHGSKQYFGKVHFGNCADHIIWDMVRHDEVTKWIF